MNPSAITFDLGLQGPPGPPGPDGPPPPLGTATPQPLGTAATGTATGASHEDHVHAHGDQAGGTLHAAATGSVAGFLSVADKTKLDGVTETTTATHAYADAGDAAHANSDGASIQGNGTSGTPYAVKALGIATSMLQAAAVTAAKLAAALFSGLTPAAATLAGAPGTSVAAFAREDHAHPFPTGVGQSGQVTTARGGLSITSTTPGAYPYTTLDSDYKVNVDTTLLRTILLRDGSTEAEVIVADAGDLAGTNAITVGLANSAKKLNGTVNGVASISTSGAMRGFWRDASGNWHGGV